LCHTRQTHNRLYRKGDEIDQRACSRCPQRRAGGIEARYTSPSWSPQLAAPQWSNLKPRAFCVGIRNLNEKNHTPMKSISQISDNQQSRRGDHVGGKSGRLLPTDYNYRPTAETQLGSSAGQRGAKLPGFHKLSSEFLSAETSWHYVAELSFFVLISGIAVWPIVSMLIAVVRMIRNY
jgi:hypothetical protein